MAFWYNEGSGPEKPFLQKQIMIYCQTLKKLNIPVGDGSGLVNFKVTAHDAITYRFIYNENIAPLLLLQEKLCEAYCYRIKYL